MNKKAIIIALLVLMSMEAKAQTDSITVKNDSITWSKELEGVTVKAQRQFIKQEIDRIGYDVQADEESKTLTVLDLLRKVPMVAVDGEDNIKVKGNSNYKIYKNGHPDPSLTKNAKEILKSIPASMVKRIEVITDPGAREDAEGVDAILNIVMMDGRSFNGVTGGVNLSYSTLKAPSVSGNMTTQIGKAILSIDAGYNKMTEKSSTNIQDTERTYLTSGRTMKVHQEGSNPGHIFYADLGGSFDIDTLNLISASFGGYFYKLNVQGEGPLEMYDANKQILYSYNDHYWMPGYMHHSWNGRLDYEHKTHCKGEKLTFSYMLALTRQRTEQESSYTDIVGNPFYYTGYLVNSKENFTENTFQTDYIRPLWAGHKIEIGGKYIDRRNNSHTLQDYYQWTQPPSFSTEFDHTTRVAAAYADYHLIAGKWSARTGLRYEYSYMSAHYPDGKSNDFNDHLNDWVPQASIKYQINDANSLKLNYSTSISRPGISYLNPAVIEGPEGVDFGNDHLTSSHQQSLTLLYMFVSPRLTLQLAPMYKFFNGGIGDIRYIKNNKLYSTYDNIERLRRYQVEGYLQWKPFDYTTIVANGYVQHNSYRNLSLQLEKSAWDGFYYVSLTQQLPWKLRLTLSSYGQIGHEPYNVYSYSRSFYSYSAALQRSFLKEDRLTLRLFTYMPFRKYQRSASVTDQGDYTAFSENQYIGRRFQISLSYRFGKLKASVKKTETTIENDDVVGGISKGK
jgi:hypothetical protein